MLHDILLTTVVIRYGMADDSSNGVGIGMNNFGDRFRIFVRRWRRHIYIHISKIKI
jgi:hypothetical protein